MSVTAVALVVATSLYCGFQWTVRLVVYPQFAGVGRTEFAAYELAHQRRIAVAVGPLFAALVIATGAVVLDPPGGVAWELVAASVVLVGVVLGVTGLLAVPLHRALSAGFDADVHRRLLAVDSIRLLAASLDTVVAVALVLH